jgi:hypothetical protein
MEIHRIAAVGLTAALAVFGTAGVAGAATTASSTTASTHQVSTSIARPQVWNDFAGYYIVYDACYYAGLSGEYEGDWETFSCREYEQGYELSVFVD